MLVQISEQSGRQDYLLSAIVKYLDSGGETGKWCKKRWASEN